jgi:7-cyano-7-deazaguanine synthase in queuosine biosynthesis
MYLAQDPLLELTALHVNYGQVAFHLERKACEFFCGKYDVEYRSMTMDLRVASPRASIVGGDGGDMMDGRNVVLISVAAMWAAARGASEIYVGFHKEPANHPFPDATEVALDVLQLMLDNVYQASLYLEAPFKNDERIDIVSRAAAKEPRFFSHTHTCYKNVEGGCGQCAHCKQKMAYEKELRG